MFAGLVRRSFRHNRDGGDHSSLIRAVGLGTAAALVLVGATTLSAQAAPGDTSNATGQYLGGSLLGLDAALVASLGGESATSSGTDQTNANNLNVGVLGAVTLTAPGGIQLPLGLGSAGVVSQYASALGSGASVGASGLTSAAGDIGTGITPAPGVAPGPLHVNLGQAVTSLGLPSVSELANLDLTAGVTAARAAQASPAAATGSYSLADVGLTFDSATIAGLSAAINARVATVQGLVDGLAGPGGTLASVLDALPLGVVTTTATVDPSNLGAAVAPLLTGPITDPANPGVTIDLSTGTVSVDLAAITALEGLPANTSLLTDAVINTIGARISGVVTSLLTRVQTTLTNTVNALHIQATTSLGIVPVVTIDETIGQLLAADTSGIALAGIALTIPGLLGTIIADLTSTATSPLGAISASIAGLESAVIAPVTSTLVPALKPVLNGVLQLTVNNQSTAAGVFTETGLRATVLPAASALVLNVATATVGPDALAVPPAITSLTPTHGPVAGGTAVTITGTGFTGATGVTFGGIAGTGFTVVNDTTITVTTPAHVQGVTNVVVLSPNGNSGPGTFTFDPAPPAITSLTPTHGPVAGGTAVTITGTGFTGATAVTFGGTPAAAFTVVNDTTIAATSPAHAVGPVNVTVQTPNGVSGPGTFTFDAALVAPVITAIAPSHGPEIGGTPVTITGTGFTGATGVTFGGIPGTAFTVVSNTTITVTTPAHSPAAVGVIVQSPAGNSIAGSFTFDPVTTVDGITPNTGPAAGGTAVTISGHCFVGATGVLFGTTPATTFTVVNDTTITAVSPAGTGTVDVTVVGSAACGTGVIPRGFTYVDPAATGSGTTGTTSGLASTGSDLAPSLGLAGLAVLLLLAGAAMFVRRSKRNA